MEFELVYGVFLDEGFEFVDSARRLRRVLGAIVWLTI